MNIPEYYLDRKDPTLQINIHTAIRKCFNSILSCLLHDAISRSCDRGRSWEYQIAERFRSKLIEFSNEKLKHPLTLENKKKFLCDAFCQSVFDVCEEDSVLNSPWSNGKDPRQSELDEWKRKWSKNNWEHHVFCMLWRAFCEDPSNVKAIIGFIFPDKFLKEKEQE